MKKLAIVAALAAGGLLVWNQVPGVRTAFSDAREKLTGWSDEDRRNDPVGYIQHARGELRDNIAAYEGLLVEVDAMETENQAKLDGFAREERGANELLAAAREEFASAEAAGKWPVEFFDGTYTRTEFIDQVETWMAEKSSASRQVESYQRNLDLIRQRRSDLRARIQGLQNAVVDLETKEATLKVAALSESDSALLAEVDSLLRDSTEALAGSSPVRSVKDVLAQQDADAAAAEMAAEKEASRAAVLDFLNS